jgi:ribonucleoside-diphosphate reductase alpha chain
MVQQKLPIDFDSTNTKKTTSVKTQETKTEHSEIINKTTKDPVKKDQRGQLQINKSTDYCFGRISTKEELCWDDVVKRFITELQKRGAKTSTADLEWLCMNYYALPNSPALLTSGTNNFHASACSSYPVMDSMDEGNFSILDTLRISSMATKAGIGTGFDFSNIRSKEETVKGRIGVTGGPVSFIKAYNGFMSEITQSTRKSASMGLLHVNHPDIFDYVNCKTVDGEIAGFNLSVIIDDKFMQAVVDDTDYELKYIKQNKNGEKTKSIKARELFDLMCQRIWDNGEPGVMFADTIKNDYFEDEINILANPCSEALLSYGKDWLELCVLASINLPKYLELPENERRKAVSTTVSMLNDIIDVQDYVVDYQAKGMKERNRKIGIGVAGFATVLAKRGLKYSSPEGKELAKQIFAEIGTYAQEASAKLGNIDVVIDGKKTKLGRYNGSLLSVAPTSTLSNIFNFVNEEGCSYGIEPYFSLDVQKIKNSYGEFEHKEKIIDYLDGKTDHIETANTLDYKSHLGPVEAYYNSNPKGIVQGCSKTINFKNNVTVEDVKDAVLYCWKNKIKAISFYRDGSRQNQVISTKDSYTSTGRPQNIHIAAAPKRPNELPCDIYHVTSSGEKWLVLVGLLDAKPYEVFAGLEEKINIPHKMKQGLIRKEKGVYNLVINIAEEELCIRNIPSMFENEQFGTITRLTSVSLRHGTPLKFICEQLVRDGGFDAFNKAIARVLKNYIVDEEESGIKCPKCNQKMRYVQGCLTCDCGYSKCS